jgi:hypothetical protein
MSDTEGSQMTVEIAGTARTEAGLRDLREGRWLIHDQVVALFEQKFGPAG